LTCKDLNKEPADAGGCRPKSCSEGTYLSETSCEPCHATCSLCLDSPTNCSACVKNAKRSETDCVCLEDYQENDTGCKKPQITFRLTVSSDNDLTLTFSSDVNLTHDDLTLAIEGLSDFTFILEELSAQEWKVILDTSQAISDGAQVTVTITNPSIGGEASLASNTATGTLTSQSVPLTTEEAQAAAIGATTAAASTTSVSTSIALSFSSGSMSSTWGMINNIQIVGYIPMMHIDLPIGLSSFFKSMQGFSLVPNLFQYFVTDDSPKNFESARRVGIDSSLFLMNAGELISTFFLTMLFWPVSCALSNCSNPKLAKYFSDVSSSFRWSFFIRFVIEGYINLTFAALFQLHNATAASFSLLANVCLAGVFMVLSFVFPVVCVYFVYKNYERFQDPEEKDFRTKFGSVFDEFKNNKGLLSCSFYCLFFLRRLLHVGILYLLQDYPLVQVILNFLHSLGALMFLLVFRPYKEKYLNFSNIYAELCITLTFGLLGLFLLNLTKSIEVILMWSTLGVIYSMMLVNFLVTCLLTVRECHRLCQKWHNRRAGNQQSISVLA
jgi:hypothetical protein